MYVVKTGEVWCSFRARTLVFLFLEHVFGEMELTRDTSSRPRGEWVP